MKFPELLGNQFALLMANIQTGHVLKKDHSLFLANSDTEAIFEVFDAFDRAKNFAQKKISEYPQIECVIYDHANKALYYCSKDKQISLG